jgi:zinc/manganese transport system substrate-binding protein
MRMRYTFAALVAFLLLPATAWAAGPVTVVAAENFYGDVAQQIGGSEVKVTSILSNPDEDPHLFEASPSVARAISGARIAVYNGIDYDPWMEKLLGAAKSTDRKVIDVAKLVGRKSGDNPHIWYDANTMLAHAKQLANDLGRIDPSHKAVYLNRLEQHSMQPIQAKIAELHKRLAGTAVTATEPVFGICWKRWA